MTSNQFTTSGLVYVLRFARPLGDPDNPHGLAQTYIGYCDRGRLEDRIAEHRAGVGAAITRAAVAQGIDFQIAAVLEGSRALERRLKQRKSAGRLLAQLARGSAPYGARILAR